MPGTRFVHCLRDPMDSGLPIFRQYLDCPATDKRFVVNSLDFRRREGDQFTENWVFVDMIHLFRRHGVDLLARVHCN